VEPHLDQTIRYIGPVDVPGKNELFAHARALLHLNTIPERFGLVLAEANAAGVSVIAMTPRPSGFGRSCRWQTISTLCFFTASLVPAPR
jgi:hypothetical protein